MEREIKFSLVYRDMWQSSGKYMPRVDQLIRVAPHIINMGCFDRVETNGGGFEQINLLFGENPNKSVREWTQPFNDAGIETHMLERSLNGLRMNPVPADVRRLNFKVKKRQGVDIARSFCGLNDDRNLLDSIKYAQEGGMIAQAALSLTYSKVHTVEYFVNLADTLIRGGADEICLKDMAGIARPDWLGRIVKGIKALHPNVVLEYHSHAAPGFAMASILEVARAGVEYIDVGMEPLSWGTGHPDLLAVHAMLKDAGFKVPNINMEAYMKVRGLTQEFIDDFLGYYINPRNRLMNSLLIGPGLPGGMMGSLMADLENNLESINKWLVKNNKEEISQDDLLVKLFEEVQYVWPMVGYPPLVTPYSQYVKNLSLMNVMQMIKGRERFTMVADNIWDMILGKAGKLPGPVAPELIELAKSQGKEFYTGHPQAPYPDSLDTFRKEMSDKGWEFGQDDEELMELAMHPEQYRNYKSGKAKSDFEADLAEKKRASAAPDSHVEKADHVATGTRHMTIDVDGQKFSVTVSFDDLEKTPVAGEKSEHKTPADTQEQTVPNGVHAREVLSPLEGTFHFTKESSERAIKVGDKIHEGDLVGYVEAMKTYNAITSDVSGTVVEICTAPDSEVDEDDVLIKVQY